MCCTRLAENTGCQRIAKNSSSGHYRTTLPGRIFATQAHIDNQKKRAKQQYLLNTSSEYGGLRPINGSILEFEAPQQISTGFAYGFVTAATSLTGGQPNFV